MRTARRYTADYAKKNDLRFSGAERPSIWILAFPTRPLKSSGSAPKVQRLYRDVGVDLWKSYHGMRGYFLPKCGEVSSSDRTGLGWNARRSNPRKIRERMEPEAILARALPPEPPRVIVRDIALSGYRKPLSDDIFPARPLNRRHSSRPNARW